MSIEITGISSMATRQVLNDLSRFYRRQTGQSVAIRSMGGVDAARLVRAGDVTDLVVLASTVMRQLEAEAHIVSGTIADFARSGMAIAIRTGAARPDIGDTDAVKKAILQAQKIGYSSGPSGDHLLQLCDRWGLSASVSQRMIKAPPGTPVGTLIARGDVDLGFQQLSELLHLPGIEIVGPLPPEIQTVTVFSAGLSSTAPHVEATHALLAYLTSPDAEAAKRQHGMEPA